MDHPEIKESIEGNGPAPPDDGGRGDSEALILFLGFSTALLYLLALGWVFLKEPEKGRVLMAMTTTNILFGRAAGLSFGIAGGLGNSVVVLANMLLEVIQVLVIYPLFVLSWKHLLDIRPLKEFMSRMHSAAEKKKRVIQRYGIIGLFIFVWIPFWMTGPVVGAIIGFLIGLRSWVSLTVVLSGTCLAILAWALLIQKLHSLVEGYGSFVPMAMVLGFILVILLRRVYAKGRGKPE